MSETIPAAEVEAILAERPRPDLDAALRSLTADPGCNFDAHEIIELMSEVAMRAGADRPALRSLLAALGSDGDVGTDAIPPERPMRARPRRVRGCVAFIACGGLLKVAQPDRRSRAVTCPRCGETHRTMAARERYRGEECLTLPVELVEPDPTPTPTPTPAADPDRWTAPSDADVLAAIPADWRRADDIAAALDYGNRRSFNNRLAQMRKRGAAIETRAAYQGAPTYVRRTDPDAVKS